MDPHCLGHHDLINIFQIEGCHHRRRHITQKFRRDFRNAVCKRIDEVIIDHPVFFPFDHGTCQKGFFEDFKHVSYVDVYYKYV